ncbi:MAG: tetratricopeptide repeat protein [Bacteroidales bacterium]|nr:tetratricopeptide repeat protein [Bacteroidales bacterium]
MKAKSLASTIGAVILSVLSLDAQSPSAVSGRSVVTLQPAGEDGKYTIETSVNGVGVRTYYTEENWFVSMSTTTYLFLYENGYIHDEDVKGITTLKLPDGSSSKGAAFVIRKLKIGDHILVTDIPAFVVSKQNVPFIIGSSVFESLGGVTREGDRIVTGDPDGIESIAEVVDPVDSLRLAAQTHLEAEEYSEAIACYSALKEKDALNMLSEYQYAMLLGITGKDNENVSVSRDWLAPNEGKSMTMDYWILSGLGASYARLKDNSKAIESLEKAVSVYYRLFNTSEKGIKAGNFRDDNLGATLYRLGRVYAAEGKVSKTESNCALAAKCGYQSAIDFCKQYKIKY